jgi:hypothetical protein
MTRKLSVYLLLIPFLFTGCNLPMTTSPVPGAGTPLTPDPPPVTVIVTTTSDYRPCVFQWATQPLPDLTIQLAETLAQAGLETSSARAEAYGENCIDENGQVVYFATKETDFWVVFKVPSLDEEAELARLLEAALTVLDQFPPEETPGPQPGYIGIAFENTSGGLINLWFQVSRSDELRKQGLGGVELLKALRNP